MSHRHSTKVIISIITLIVVGFAVWLFAPTVVSWLGDYRKELQEENLKSSQLEFERIYMADTNGGKTPEATLRLLLTALSANNTLQASKYFEVVSQLKAISYFQGELAKYGDLSLSLAYFSNGMKSGSLQFRLNKFSGVWKIKWPEGQL